jgi:DNA-binding protein HU-beta
LRQSDLRLSRKRSKFSKKAPKLGAFFFFVRVAYQKTLDFYAKVNVEPGGEAWLNQQGPSTWRFQVNKAELIDLVAERADISKKDATAAVDAIFDGIKSAVAKGDKVSLSGFGIFEKSDRAARTGRNPQTGAPVTIAATSVPKFRAGAEFKKHVSGK